MSGFLGGGGNATAPTVYTGIQIQTSAQGVPITLVWGTKRIGTNLIWYNDFTATNSSGKKGGKGGDGKGSALYTYTAAVILALGEGTINGVGTVWADRNITSLAELGLTFFPGTATQAPWSFPAANYPTESLAYAYTSYVANSAYALGYSPNLPNHNFEVIRLQTPWADALSNKDCYMAFVIQDFLTNPQYSVGLSVDNIDYPSFLAYKTYCSAQGLNMSPDIQTQEQVGTIIDRWAQLTNTWVFWSGDLLKAVPLGDAEIANGTVTAVSVSTIVPLDQGPESTYTYVDPFSSSQTSVISQTTGTPFTLQTSGPSSGGYLYNGSTHTWTFNSADTGKGIIINYTRTFTGSTYVPNSTIVFALTTNDYIAPAGQPPVKVTRADPADCPNYVRLEFKNRNNAYNSDIAEWKDQGLVNQFGLITHPQTQAYEITDPVVAQNSAALMGQRAAYIRNTYEFTVNWWQGTVIEPGDLLTLTEPGIGLVALPVRVQILDEDESGAWKITAEEAPFTTGVLGTVQPLPTGATGSGPVDTNVAPGSINPPAIWEPPATLTGGVPQVWIAASGGVNWGGAAVMLSLDGTTYQYLGMITQAAVQGVLTADLPLHADPDTTDTLAIDTTISDSALNNEATDADADAYRTLCLVTNSFTTVVPSNGEAMAYGTVAITGAFADNLTYLRRAIYQTASADHPTGSFFTRLNVATKGTVVGDSILVYDLPAAYIGKPLYFKFLSANRFGNSAQTLADATEYSYTPTGIGFGTGGGGLPSTPTNFMASPAAGGITVLSWNQNPAGDNVDFYALFAASGLNQPFTAATQVGTSTSTNFDNVGLAANSQYTYFIEAHNAVGYSLPSVGVNSTSSAGEANLFRLSGNLAGPPSASQLLFEVEMQGGETFPAGFVGSLGGCDATGLPTGSIACIITQNGAQIGTMNIAAGSSSATFSSSASVTFAAQDRMGFYAPSTVDATLTGLVYTFVGAFTIAAPTGGGTGGVGSGASQVATPTFSPAPGTYFNPVTVSIADTTPGATIFYTEDGTTPVTGGAVANTGAPVAAPAQAAAVGYTHQTFGPNPTVGTSPGELYAPAGGFFTTSPQDGDPVQQSDGSLILNGSATSNLNIGSVAPDPTGTNKWKGKVFGGGGYFEATFSFNPGTGDPGQSWPAWFLFDVESMVGIPALCQWPGQASVYTDRIEVDIMEFLYGIVTQYGRSIHNWYGLIGSNTAVSAPGSQITLPSGVTFNAANKFGFLWVPATNSTQGYGQAYLNDVAVGDRIAWNKYDPTLPPPPVSGSSAYSVMDVRHLALLMGTGAAYPLHVTSMNVWQASEAGNIVQSDGDLAGTSATYTGSLTIAATTTIEAMGVETGYLNSNVATGVYTIVTSPPVITPASGTYSAAFSVTLTAATTGASIYYTTDGSTPTSASTLYSAPFTVSGSETVKAIAIASGVSGAVSTAAYVIGVSPFTAVWADPLPDAVEGQFYDYTPTLSGGVPPYLVVQTSSTPLPAGLTLTATTGRISGTPTVTMAMTGYTFDESDSE